MDESGMWKKLGNLLVYIKYGGDFNKEIQYLQKRQK